jgi:uncharacterized membrane protein YoaK (UPF0700 family)
LPPRVRDALLLTLTTAAGSADAVSFLGLGRVFTANMTGNLVLLGIAIGQGQFEGPVRSVIALAGFAAGVLIGVRLTAKTERLPSPSRESPPSARGGANDVRVAGFPAWAGSVRGQGGGAWPRSVTLALLAELGLLLAFLAGWEIAGDRPAALPLDVLVAFSAMAMGVQAAAARHLNVVGVTTVFVTGMLTSLVADLATMGPGRPHWILWAISLGFLVTGAAIGAVVFIAWRPGAPLVAALLVAAVIVTAAAATLRRDSRES